MLKEKSVMKRIFKWIFKALMLAVLVAFTLLLAWAFESRTMPAAQIQIV